MLGCQLVLVKPKIDLADVAPSLINRVSQNLILKCDPFLSEQKLVFMALSSLCVGLVRLGMRPELRGHPRGIFAVPF